MIVSTMQEGALTTQLLVDRMTSIHAHKRVFVGVDRDISPRTFAETAARTRRVAGWMLASGLREGDCVATLLWNCHEHLELFLAVPSVGCVLHTINTRLSAETINAMLAETRPRALFVDVGMAQLFEALTLPAETTMVVGVSPSGTRPAMASDSPVLDYTTVMAAATPLTRWPMLKEQQACAICYTSGTSGKSKGVVYSHRSAILHAIAMLGVDAIAMSEKDVCFPIVPMFHALGWGFPYAACMSGAELVFSYRNSDPASIAHLVHTCDVTLATAVPTVWSGVLDAVRRGDVDETDLKSLRRLPIGGAAVSEDLVSGFEAMGISVQHCWGMTEVSPLGLVSSRRAGVSDEEWRALRMTPGMPLPGCELRVISEQGHEVPRDGRSPGELQASGPWVTGAYFDPASSDGHSGAGSFVTDGRGQAWLKTGDVATWDTRGYVRIVDRAKDLIKSGGEWISSIELESALCTHPAVSEAAVVPIPDSHWQERPLAYVSLVRDWPGQEPDLKGFLAARLPKWQVPDRVIVLLELPKGATGKIDKRRLRQLAASAPVA